MTKIIPNDESFVGFATTVASIAAPTVANVTAAVNLTPLLVSITASSQGNTVPTPTLDTLFESSIGGTSSAQFSADFYRDDTNDAAWITLPRGTVGYFIISRFNGTGTNHRPVAGQRCEVWPVIVTSRSSAALASNTAQTFTVTCSVPTEPAENAQVVA